MQIYGNLGSKQSAKQVNQSTLCADNTLALRQWLKQLLEERSPGRKSARAAAARVATGSASAGAVNGLLLLQC